MKPMTDKHLAILRRHMVEMIDVHYDLASDEIGKEAPDPRVRDAMLKVPRHLFVPAQLAIVAYNDSPLPLGFDKTVSQPFIGALMIDLLQVEPGNRVLEVGTGLGYQAAILAELGARVWSVEIVEEFAGEARARLMAFGYGEVTVKVGDGSRGWPEHAPFDRILVTAASREIPAPLIDQLAPGGRMVIPLGPKDEVQQLSLIEKSADGETGRRDIMPVRFTQLEESAPVPSAGPSILAVQVDSPTTETVDEARASFERIPGVSSALTTDVRPGGLSEMRITYSGDPATLQAALRDLGWTVEVAGKVLRISRTGGLPATELG